MKRTSSTVMEPGTLDWLVLSIVLIYFGQLSKAGTDIRYPYHGIAHKHWIAIQLIKPPSSNVRKVCSSLTPILEQYDPNFKRSQLVAAH